MIVLRNKTFSKKKDGGEKSIKGRFTKLIEKGKEIQEEKRKNLGFFRPQGYGVDPIDASHIHQQFMDFHHSPAIQSHMIGAGMM